MAQEHLFPKEPAPPEPELRDAHIRLLLPKSLRDRLFQTCDAAGVSVNDVVVRHLAHALSSDWIELALNEAQKNRKQRPSPGRPRKERRRAA